MTYVPLKIETLVPHLRVEFAIWNSVCGLHVPTEVTQILDVIRVLRRTDRYIRAIVHNLSIFTTTTTTLLL